MSGKVSGMVWELDIPQRHAWVLMSLADHAEHDGTQVFPGNGLTAWKTGYSVSQIKRIIRDLIHEYGLLEVVVTGGGNSRSEYRICLERFGGLKKPPPTGRGRPKGERKDETKNRGHNYKPGLSDPSPVGSSTRARGETSLETSYSRKGSKDLPNPLVNPMGYFSVLADIMEVNTENSDRKHLPKQFKDLLRIKEPGREEMVQVITHILSERLKGYDVSPQKAWTWLHNRNVYPLARQETKKLPAKRWIS